MKIQNNYQADHELKIKEAIGKALPTEIPMETIRIEHPQEESHGDYSTNVAMSLAKELKQSPREIADELASALKKDEEFETLVDKIEVAGPGFVNFFLSSQFLNQKLEEVFVKGDDFGKSEWGSDQTWVIEHTSPNPNKAMHIGHLRTNLTGMALGNIWEAMGVKVIRDMIDNNRGIAIAKLMWGYLKHANKNNEDQDLSYWFEHQDEWLTPEAAGERPDKFVDKYYVAGSDDYKIEENQEAIKRLVLDWEDEDKMTWALWEKVLSYSYQGQEATLKRLGSKFDHVWHEHEHYKLGKALVEKGLEKGIFQHSEGAIVTDFEKYNIPDTVLIKSDGTSLYITQDLALTKLKRDKFKADKLFWVIGPEQTLAMRQVFTAMEQLGIGKLEDYTHIPYGFMSLKGVGKMSSREGNVIYIDDLLDTAAQKITAVLKEKDYQDDDLDVVAEKLGVGAVKYSLLKVARNTDVQFDYDESLSFEGDSGPYLVYTYARANSILSKATDEITFTEMGNLNEYEAALARTLYQFPQVVMNAGLLFSPNLIASYLFDLAQKFNSFYKNVPVLNEENEQNRLKRLVLTRNTVQVLKNGLKLLGIEVLEKM